MAPTTSQFTRDIGSGSFTGMPDCTQNRPNRLLPRRTAILTTQCRCLHQPGRSLFSLVSITSTIRAARVKNRAGRDVGGHPFFKSRFVCYFGLTVNKFVITHGVMSR